MINQRVARAFVRVHRPGALTFAAISEVGVGGRRVDGGHRLNSQSRFDAVRSLLRLLWMGLRCEDSVTFGEGPK